MNIASLFSPTIDVPALVRQKFAGQTLDVMGTKIGFDKSLAVTSDPTTHELTFSPPAVVTRRFVPFSVNVSGARIEPDQIVFVIDGWPDLSINLKW